MRVTRGVPRRSFAEVVSELPQPRRRWRYALIIAPVGFFYREREGRERRKVRIIRLLAQSNREAVRRATLLVNRLQGKSLSGFHGFVVAPERHTGVRIVSVCYTLYVKVDASGATFIMGDTCFFRNRQSAALLKFLRTWCSHRNVLMAPWGHLATAEPS